MGSRHLSLTPKELFLVRVVLAVVWLYNGLILKLITVDPEHLKIVEAVGGFGPVGPRDLLFAIGLGETLLGLGILSGRFYRPICYFQIVVIVLMNAVGIASGGVAEPLGLVVTNLPLVALMWTASRCGPGSLTVGS